MYKQERPLLSIIIVNYNVKEEIVNCIQSIKDNINFNNTPYEIIVADNGSADGSTKTIKERFPWVIVVENNSNLGFGKANNIGAKQAKGKVFFFLNPDTRVLGGIEEMVMFLLNHPETGICGPLIFDRENKEVTYFEMSVYLNLLLQITDLMFTPLARLYFTYKRFTFRKKVNDGKPFTTNLIHGSAMMFNKTAFDAVGGFDEDLFMYGEEADIGIKMKKQNYRITIFPQARIVHYEGSSTKQTVNTKKDSMCTVAMKTVLKRHFPRTWYIRYNIEMLSQLRQIAISSINAYSSYFNKKKYINYRGMVLRHLAQYRLLKTILHS